MLFSELGHMYAERPGRTLLAMSSMGNPRDQINARTPMRCPICDGQLEKVRIRDLGGITADLVWQLHAGECPQHGWFQTEVISRPPREIFAVDRPFGIARRMIVDGEEHFSFPTVWNDQSGEVKRSRVDPFDARYWRPRRLARADVRR